MSQLSLRPYLLREERSGDLAVFRVLLAVYGALFGVVRLDYLLGFRHQPATSFQPIGLARLWDHFPSNGIWLTLCLSLTPLALVWLWGRWPVVGLLYAGVLTLTLSFSNAFGMILHTENLLCLHVIIVAIGSQRVSRSAASTLFTPATTLYLCAWATALAYLISGTAKLRLGGFAFLSGDTLQTHIAVDNLRKILLGDSSSPLAEFALRQDALAGTAAVVVLALELAAPLALWWRRGALVWSALMWLFHLGVLALMAIAFVYPLVGMAFAPFLPLGAWVRRLSVRRRDLARS